MALAVAATTRQDARLDDLLRVALVKGSRYSGSGLRAKRGFSRPSNCLAGALKVPKTKQLAVAVARPRLPVHVKLKLQVFGVAFRHDRIGRTCSPCSGIHKAGLLKGLEPQPSWSKRMASAPDASGTQNSQWQRTPCLSVWARPEGTDISGVLSTATSTTPLVQCRSVCVQEPCELLWLQPGAERQSKDNQCLYSLRHCTASLLEGSVAVDYKTDPGPPADAPQLHTASLVRQLAFSKAAPRRPLGSASGRVLGLEVLHSKETSREECERYSLCRQHAGEG